MRKKIGVYVDYALRTPSFNAAYTLFKESLFKIQTEFSTEEEKDIELVEGSAELDIVRFYWKAQLENKEIEEFYVKTICKKEDYELKSSTWKEYFYNEEHWKKFLEEYTFNLYADAEAPCNRDIDLLNIAQKIFDVILIDEYIVPRKKLNTFYFLSKIRIQPQALLFLGPGQNTAEETYFGIWNPKRNSDQENREGEANFEMWLKELESKLTEI